MPEEFIRLKGNPSLVRSYLHHEGVRRVDEVGHVALRRALEAELAVGGHRVVHEDDGGGESAVVQDLAVVLTQLAAALRLETELVLQLKVRNTGSDLF